MGRGPALGELPKIWRFPFNVHTMSEASDFKFGKQLGFAKAHHKITPIGKVGVASGSVSSPKCWGYPIIFMQRLKLPASKLARC